ncbi:MAG: ABC transporter ATP-binding protein [Clostridia bacterium]|nr:ABC transporter ATP-binding protein [Clostridia bacterium]
MTLLQLRDVHYDYTSSSGVTHALRGVDAEFLPGNFYALTGRSGCGKTTLLSLIAAFDRPLRGDILLDGTSIFAQSATLYRRKNIGMIFQSYQLIPHLTALENVMLAFDIARVQTPLPQKKAAARQCLSQVGLGSAHEKKFPRQLSGGEQQRVAIARTLAADPPILLADEPTGNLDSENSENIVSLLRAAAHERGKCVIVVTHAEEIAEKADIRFHMTDGKINKA